jgi:hypothetical protein
VKEDEMGRACSTYGEKRNKYRVFVGKPDGKIPLGWGMMSLGEIGWGWYGFDSSCSGYEPVKGSCEFS